MSHKPREEQLERMEQEAKLYELATLIYEQLKLISSMMARLAGEEQEAIKEPHRGDVL